MPDYERLLYCLGVRASDEEVTEMLSRVGDKAKLALIERYVLPLRPRTTESGLSLPPPSHPYWAIQAAREQLMTMRWRAEED